MKALAALLATVLWVTPQFAQATVSVIDFETDTGTFNDYLGGVLTRVSSGTDGVTASSGSFYGKLVMGASSGSGAFTFHTNTPPQVAIPVGAKSFSQSVDVFFDVDAAGAEVGDHWIFENSIEDAVQNWTEGSQFNIVKTASGWTVAGLNITNDGWYTIESSWSDTGVGWDRTATVYNGVGTLIFSSTSPPNQIAYADAKYVGYSWLSNGGGSLDAGFVLPIDNAKLTIVAGTAPEPSTFALAAFSVLSLGMARRRRR